MVDGERGGLVVLVCGLPGSGKTTLAKRLAREMPAVRLCPDEWLARLGFDLHEPGPRDRLEGLFRDHALDLARLGQNVILEFGFWSRAERDEMRLRARRFGVAVALRYLHAPVDELWRRLVIRNGSGEAGTAVVTRGMIEEWATIFETPDRDEFALFDPLRLG